MRINEKIQIYFLTNNVGVSSVTCTGRGFFVHFLSTCTGNRKRKHLSHQRGRLTGIACLIPPMRELFLQFVHSHHTPQFCETDFLIGCHLGN